MSGIPQKAGGGLRLTLQRPAGIGICLPPRLPEREGYDIQPEKGCPAKIRTDSGLILYSAQKRERGFPPVIIGTKKGSSYIQTKSGSALR